MWLIYVLTNTRGGVYDILKLYFQTQTFDERRRFLVRESTLKY